MFVFSCRLMNQLFRVMCSFTVDKYSLHLSTGIPKRGSYINAITVSVKCSKHSYQNYICYFYFLKTFSSGFSNFVILPVENSIFVLFICGWVLMSKVKFIKLEFTYCCSCTLIASLTLPWTLLVVIYQLTGFYCDEISSTRGRCRPFALAKWPWIRYSRFSATTAIHRIGIFYSYVKLCFKKHTPAI